MALAQLARSHVAVFLMGNHDEALVTGKHRFNPHLAKAIDWTRNALTAAGGGADGPMAWFKERQPFVLKGNLLLVHGSHYDPVHD